MTSSRIAGTAYATWYGADLQIRILSAMSDEPCQQAPGDGASASIAIHYSPKLPVPLPHFPMSTRLLPYTSQRPRKRVARTSTGAKRSSSQRLPCRAAFPLFASPHWAQKAQKAFNSCTVSLCCAHADHKFRVTASRKHREEEVQCATRTGDRWQPASTALHGQRHLVPEDPALLMRVVSRAHP